MILAPLFATGAGAFSVSASPELFSEGVAGDSGTTVGTTTLTITGAVGTPTAVWTAEWVEGSPTITVTSPSSITTSTYEYSGFSDVLTLGFATVTVTVTDAIGRIAETTFIVSVWRYV